MKRTTGLSIVTIVAASLALPQVASAQAVQTPPGAPMVPSSQQPHVNPSTPNPNRNLTVPNQSGTNSGAVNSRSGVGPSRGNGSNGG